MENLELRKYVISERRESLYRLNKRMEMIDEEPLKLNIDQ